MSDAELLLLVESRKKSGFVAALLNLFIPGAGYVYCGRWILGIIAFFFVIAMVLASLGFAVIPIILLLIIDGFLCAGRYNKNLVTEIIKVRASLEQATATQVTQAAEARPVRANLHSSPEPVASHGSRACPECGESVLAVARKCKHCGSAIVPLCKRARGRTRRGDRCRGARVTGCDAGPVFAGTC